MKAILVIDINDDIKKYSVDVFKQNEDGDVMLEVATDLSLRPLPQKLKDWQYADKYNRWGVSQKDIQKEIIGYNLCVDEVAGETE